MKPENCRDYTRVVVLDGPFKKCEGVIVGDLSGSHAKVRVTVQGQRIDTHLLPSQIKEG